MEKAPRTIAEAVKKVTDAPRNFDKVLEAIVVQIPRGEPAWADLRRRLTHVRESASYLPPESSQPWVLLHRALTESLPWPPTEPWQEEIGRIVRAEKDV